MPPMTRASIIARPKLFLCVVAFWFWVVAGGEGDGEGEIEEQLLRGGPHKREFPRKEVFGNVLMEFGIEPFKLL